MSSRRERLRSSRRTLDQELDAALPHEDASDGGLRQIAREGALTATDVMLLQRTIGNHRTAGILQHTSSGVGACATIQRQKAPGHYTMKQGGNLREERSPYDVIRYLPEGTPVEVRQSGDRKTTFATNPLGWGAKDHSWSYHTPTVNRFKASDQPRHGWIVDENLVESSAPKAEAVEERAKTSGSSEVTFDMQVMLLQKLAQALVKPPKQLSVQQYQSAARGWLAHSRLALAKIVQKVDKQGLFAPGIVGKLVAAQTSPENSPLIHKMIEDVMGDKMFILGDTAADMKVTDWVAQIRDTHSFLVDFPKYFKDERKPPSEEKVMTGRQFFMSEH